MLFFPPTAELASSTAATLDPMAMDSSFLLGGALMPPPSAIQQQQQQQVQSLQLQQQIFAMEQQLQQQTFLPADGGPPPPPSTFFPLFNPSTTMDANLGILPSPSLQQMSERVAIDENLKTVENSHLQPIYQSQGNLLMQSILPSSISASSFPPPISTGDQLNPPPPPHMAMPPTGPCGLCRLPILEKNFLLIDAQSWHLNCVHCADCGQNLEQLGSTCFAKDGFLYCRRDYLAKFGKHCQRCGIPIERGELVMRVPQQMPSTAATMPQSTSADSSIFHVHCFTCIFCGQMLTPGEQYTAGPVEQPGGTLFCRAHFHMNPNSQPPFGPPPAQFQSTMNSLGGNSEEEPRFLLVELKDAEGGKSELTDTHHSPSNQFIGQQIEANKENPSATELNDHQLATAQQNGGSPTSIEDFGCCTTNSNDAHSSNGGGSSSQKQKRMRTSFKHHQLRTMKHYFNLNHNPDAKDLKQLAMKTGLTKRVLQVWFQNARAKYRRSQQHKIGGTSICGGGIIDAQTASISHNPQQILLPMGPNGGYHQQPEQQQMNSMPSMIVGQAQIGQIETEMGQFPMSLPAQHPPPPILCSNPKANSLSPLDDGGSSSTMGASSISLNASADEQSSENSFQ